MVSKTNEQEMTFMSLIPMILMHNKPLTNRDSGIFLESTQTIKMLATNRLKNQYRQVSTGGNRRLAQWRVTWLIEHSTSHQLLWCIDSFVLRNPPLRQAPKL